MRNIIINSIYDLMKKNKKIFFLTADMGINLVEKFQKKYPNRYLNVGISEQNLIGVAAGLCKIGYKPFLYTISNFLIHRCYEQIRNDIVLHKLPVTLIGTSTGFDNASLGPTHHVIDDWAPLKSFPEIDIYCPSSKKYSENIIKKILINKRPSYIRIPKGSFEKIKTNNDYYYLNAGSQKIILVSYGYGAEICFDIFKSKNISSLILNKLHPLKQNLILNILKKYNKIIVFEDQMENNNLHGSLAKLLIKNKKKINLIGLAPKYYEVKNGNNKEFYLKKHKIDKESILRLLKNLHQI
jgi:transketolase